MVPCKTGTLVVEDRLPDSTSHEKHGLGFVGMSSVNE